MLGSEYFLYPVTSKLIRYDAAFTYCISCANSVSKLNVELFSLLASLKIMPCCVVPQALDTTTFFISNTCIIYLNCSFATGPTEPMMELCSELST
jgi:hypothetical protein